MRVMSNNEDKRIFADHLNVYMSSHNLNSRDVEEMCGLGKTTVFTLQKTTREPTNRTVQLLSEGFKVDVRKWLPKWEWADDE